MTARKIKSVASSTLQKILVRINLNTIIIAAIGAWVTVQQVKSSNKEQKKEEKQETVAKVDSSWRKRSETRWLKVDSNFALVISKIDSMRNNQ